MHTHMHHCTTVSRLRYGRLLFATLRPLLDKRTRAKLCVCGSNVEEYKATLLRDIAPQHLPREYGGTCDDPVPGLWRAESDGGSDGGRGLDGGEDEGDAGMNRRKGIDHNRSSSSSSSSSRISNSNSNHSDRRTGRSSAAAPWWATLMAMTVVLVAVALTVQVVGALRGMTAVT